MVVFHLFLCVRGAPTWLVASGKSLKLVTPDHWKLNLTNSKFYKKGKKCLGRVCLQRLIDTRGINFISNKPTFVLKLLYVKVSSGIKT